MHALRRRLANQEDGFTLIEVMVASFVLLVGLLGLTVMLNTSSLATSSTKAREGGVALQREVVEAARSIPFEQLANSTIVSRVQGTAGAGLGDSGAGSGWTIRRRNVTYYLTVGVCSVDDPTDKTGPHDTSTFCATGAGATSPETCRDLLGSTSSPAGVGGASGPAVGDCGMDLNLDGTVDNLTIDAAGCTGAACGSDTGDRIPEDYKRVVTLVRWDWGTGRRYSIQTTTVSNPGLSSAPGVDGLDTAAPDPFQSGNSIDFTVVTSKPAAAVQWYLDGTRAGTAGGSGVDWAFTWSMGAPGDVSSAKPAAGEVLDGSYVVSAKAFSVYGDSGATRARTVRVNRRVPYPPQLFEAGRNGDYVDFEWTRNPERDIIGYRVYRVQPSGSPVQVCGLTTALSCQDKSPPSVDTTYFMVAVDRDPATDSPREGVASQTQTVTSANNPPKPPTNVRVWPADAQGNVRITWTASLGDPDPGDAVAYYRIYRDGTVYSARYDRTSTASELEFTDMKTGGVPRTYYVAAVDGNLAESDLVVATP